MEIFCIIKAYNLNMEHEHFVSVQNAWIIGKLTHADPKKFPSLRKLMGKSYPKKKIKVQPMAEMLKAVELINAQFSGKDLRKWQQPRQ